MIAKKLFEDCYKLKQRHWMAVLDWHFFGFFELSLLARFLNQSQSGKI